MARAPTVKWTREHLLIALNLYCKLPFGQFHDTNPLIVEVAKKMGRSAGSLEMMLNNFASVDPVQKARGIRGLPGIAKKAEALWHEYFGNLGVLGLESEQLLHDLFTADDDTEVSLLAGDKAKLSRSKAPSGPTEVLASRKERRGQNFFRETVLNAYGICCCISGINVPRLLVASHIKPWGKFPEERLNPRNGLCLSALHDAAFDEGLITLDDRLNVVLSKRLRGYLPQPALEQNFVPFEGKPIQRPEKLAEPDGSFIQYHRESIFKR
jgi:putative restriction endonuclease